eukprot:scaffold327782_cov162-Cyclotella_meneghiniana.AAC.1
MQCLAAGKGSKAEQYALNKYILAPRGCTLGDPDGIGDGWDDGHVEKVGLYDGKPEGFKETEGLSEGLLLGSLLGDYDGIEEG